MDRPSRPVKTAEESTSKSPTRKKRQPSRERKKASPNRRGRPKKSDNESPDEKPRARSSSRQRGRPKSPVRNAKPKESVSPPKVSPSTNHQRSSMSPSVIITRSSYSPNKAVEPESKIEEIRDTIARRLTRNRVSAERYTPDLKGDANHKLEALPEKGPSLSLQIVWSVFYLSLMLALPALVIAGQLSCTKDTCLSWPPKVVSLTMKRLWDRDAFLWLVSYVILHLTLTALPLGPKLSSQSSRRRSGPASLVIVGGLLALFHFYFQFPLTKLLDKSLPILTASILVGTILSLVVYLSNLGREKFRLGKLANDFFVGVESNPTIGPFDVKIAIMRASFMTTIIFNGLLILKEVELRNLQKQEVTPTLSLVLLAACAFQIIYSLDFLLFESLTTYAMNKEPTGYRLLIYYLTLPFWVTLVPKYLFLARGEYEHWKVMGSAALFLIGYCIYRFSSYKKSAFKRNVDQVPLCDIVGGRRSDQVLYRGNFWSVIRHPNYLGVILQNIALTALALTTAPIHWIPIVQLLSCIVVHLLRIEVVEAASSANHRAVWSLYQNQVKYKLLPRVY